MKICNRDNGSKSVHIDFVEPALYNSFVSLFKIPVFLILLFISILILPQFLYSEEFSGFPFVWYESPDQYGAHGQNFDIVQDNRGVVYFANFIGIVEYDGETYNIIPTKTHRMVSALGISNSGTIYCAGKSEIGYLAPDSTGLLSFIDLTHLLSNEDAKYSDAIDVLCVNNAVYYITNQSVIKYFNKKISVIKCKQNSQIISAFLINDQIYCAIEGKGLCLLKDSEFTQLKSQIKNTENTIISTLIPLGKDSLLVGTSTQGLYLYTKNQFYNFETNFEALIRSSNITSGILLPDNTIAFGTSRSGILIMDKNGTLKMAINKNSGLEDDYVNNMYIDNNHYLWLALNNGIAKAEVPSHLTYFDNKTRLDGGITSIIRFEKQLYVGSLNGLYSLPQDKPRFKKIKDINTGVWDFEIINNNLYIASSTGLYKLKNDKMEKINDRFCINLQKSPDNKYLTIGTTNGLAVYDISSGNFKWIKNLTYEIRQIEYVDNENVVCNSPTEGILIVNKMNNTFTVLDSSNGSYHITGNHIFKIENDIYLSNMDGYISKFNNENQKFSEINFIHYADSAFSKKIFKVFGNNSKNLWGTTVDEMNISKLIQDGNSYKIEQKLLMPVSDFICWTIYEDNNKVTWFGGPNGIMRFDQNKVHVLNTNFLTLLRKVTVNNDSIIHCCSNSFNLPDSTRNSINLSYNQNSVQFNFAAPTFLIGGNQQYQYYLEGFDNIWSEWTLETMKEYTNLPNGNYTFHVRAKNVYNEIGQEAVFSFSIAKPWFKTLWAFIAYALVFFFIIFAFARFRAQKLIKEKRYLEELIKERTQEIVQQKEELEQQSIELENKNEELEKINIIVKSINTEINFINLLQSVMEKVRVIKGVENASALLYDSQDELFHFKASFGRDMNLLEKVNLSYEDIEKRFILPSEEIFEDIFLNNSFNPPVMGNQLDRLQKAKSLIMLLVKVDDENRGFIIMENMNRQNAFDDKSFSMVKNLKEHIISAFIKTSLLENIQNTLDELKEAQSRLVQSEKLASLGQLTAGIAHEIRNPLNFVNNFSDIAVDLSDEIKEILEEEESNLSEDAMDELNEVLEMLKDNVTKINKHGKRAEDIVNGMLQHSRGKSGEFELTDINNMINEYVNLAYHGMRAQDKEFNTSINLNFDESIDKFFVVPQDISRVFLNIANNACYALNEKSKAQGSSFKPELKVTTKLIDKKVEIRIRDNGTGMPESVKEKIFNPFFTTKPTGQGTGLGLSMSYDIISQIHNGTLEVHSQDGEFTEFVINLPLKKNK